MDFNSLDMLVCPKEGLVTVPDHFREDEEVELTTVLVLLGDDTLATLVTLATAPLVPGFSHLSL